MKRVKSSDRGDRDDRGDRGDDTLYTEKNQEHIPCSFAYKVVYVDDKFCKLVVFYGSENAVYKFLQFVQFLKCINIVEE